MTEPSEHANTDYERLRSLIGLAERTNSDLTTVVARSNDDAILAVGVVARGEDAIALDRWLTRRAAARGGVR